MSKISLIAAIDQAGGLGFANQLLTHLPADLQYFKMVTMGKPIIMGRKTYESIGRALPGRTNIVLSSASVIKEGITSVHSLNEALQLTKYAAEIVIIGGAQLFAQAMQMADCLYITRIHHQFKADVFFPEIDEQVWQCTSEQFRARDEKNKYDLSFYIYTRLA